MSRKKWILLGALAGLLIAGVIVTLVVYPFVAIFFSVARSAKEIRKTEARLQTPEIYEAVARRLALYCQSDQNLFPRTIHGAWFPKELQNLGGGWGEIQGNHAFIEMGGGFHHFGYQLELEGTTSQSAEAGQSDTAATNFWKLFLCSEGSESKLLTKLALSASEHLSQEELHKLVETGYDRLIATHPAAYEGKVMTLLRFGKTKEAAGACKEWSKLQPNHWLPRFTLAHLRCRLGESDAASTEFDEWVHAHQNFAHCIYLALFNYREGNTNAALEAVRLALAQPFVEPPQTSGNKLYLGHNGAMIAYLSGDYDLCLATCEKMLADRKDRSWERIISQLRAAAVQMKSGTAIATVETKNLDWFTPYDTDESGWHGSEDIPSPYPKTWKFGKVSSDSRQ